MKVVKNIFIAFILNVCFSLIEFFGGIFTGSISIISDSVHDMGDAISIGISYYLEKISRKKPDSKYSYGYIRYSILGALVTTVILIAGSILVFYNAILRIINPVEINYNGMVIFAIIGLIINSLAAYFTKEGDSLNETAVNLHMLEDVLGWVAVLIGALVIKFTKFYMIDSIISILVALFIVYSASKNLKRIVDLFLVKTPEDVSINNIKVELEKIDGVKSIHHIHVWSIDGESNYATMHVVSELESNKELKDKIRKKLKTYNIVHVTIEIEDDDEVCDSKDCNNNFKVHHHHH